MYSKTNKDSCVLDSFAHATKLPASDLMAAVGHDGEGTGFHTQELIGVLVEHGFAVTPIELYPVAKDTAGSVWTIEFQQGHLRRFCKVLSGTTGVLTGYDSLGRPHAVAWGGMFIWDFAKGTHHELLVYRDGDAIGFRKDCPFKPVCYWKVDKVQG